MARESGPVGVSLFGKHTMSERWRSLSDMVSELNLQASPDDRAAVRAEIRKGLSEFHPDRNGGAFRGAEQESRCHLLNEALDYLDSDRQLVRNAAVNIQVLADALRQAIGPTAQARRDAIRAEYKERAKNESRSQFLAPKIGSGVFAAICAALAAFSGSLKDNPVFGPFFQTGTGVISLLVLFSYSGMFFLIT